MLAPRAPKCTLLVCEPARRCVCRRVMRMRVQDGGGATCARHVHPKSASKSVRCVVQPLLSHSCFSNGEKYNASSTLPRVLGARGACRGGCRTGITSPLGDTAGHRRAVPPALTPPKCPPPPSRASAAAAAAAAALDASADVACRRRIAHVMGLLGGTSRRQINQPIKELVEVVVYSPLCDLGENRTCVCSCA